jgi:hypothetical protein
MRMRDIERVIGFDGKTVAKIEFDGYENFCITFTDGTELAVRERMQAGQITWDADLYSGVSEDTEV